MKEANATGMPDNLFRIYRHDYDSAPLSLMESTFLLDLPYDSLSYLNEKNASAFELEINGTGDGATGILDFDSQQIVILSGGKGFVEEPVLQVLGLESNESDSNTTILTLDPSWIRVPAGTDANVSAILRDFNQSAPRGLRGMTIDASQYVPQTSSELGSSLGAYWLSYRRNVSEFGLSVILGTAETSLVPDETDNNTPYLDYLLDMTLHTPDDFTDAYLLPGFTFSDYEADVHVTPLSKGGIYPMEYLNVVVLSLIHI